MTNVEDVRIADTDGDGSLDLVALLRNLDQLAVALGDGSGAFAAPVTSPVDDATRRFALHDVDGDGAVDLVLTDGDSNALVVQLGLGDGTFAAPTRFDAGGPFEVLVEDLDGDRIPDVLTTNVSTGSVTTLSAGGSIGPDERPSATTRAFGPRSPRPVGEGAAGVG